MVKKIAIIPARSGSKRIINKNIVEFCGFPMIYWTIKAALDSKIFDRVVVSTDSIEYKNISQKYGAEVPFLRTVASDDFSNVSDVMISQIPLIESHYGEKYNLVYSLMPNCPLRTAQDIIKFDNYFTKNNFDYLLSSTNYLFTNPWWGFVKNNYTTNYENIFENEMGTRSQDLEDIVTPSGAIWSAKRDYLIESGSFYGPNFHFYKMNWISAIDIDNSEEIEVARLICKGRLNSNADNDN